MLGQERPGVTLEPSEGEDGTVFVTGRDAGPNGYPSLVLAAEPASVSTPVVGAASRLSPAEREVLAMVGRGRSVPDIATARQISHKTVRNHMASIYRKLDLKNRVEAMLFAARMGLVADVADGAQPLWADDPAPAGTNALGGEAIPIPRRNGHWDDP